MKPEILIASATGYVGGQLLQAGRGLRWSGTWGSLPGQAAGSPAGACPSRVGSVAGDVLDALDLTMGGVGLRRDRPASGRTPGRQHFEFLAGRYHRARSPVCVWLPR